MQNINVVPGTAYQYEVVAFNGTGASAQMPPTPAVTAATPTVQYQDTFTGSFPGNNWNITTAGTGAPWVQNDIQPGSVSQTSTAVGDPKKAFLQSVTDSSSTPFIVEGLVHIDSWQSGESARAGIAAFTNPTTGQGYNLVLTGRFSNTGTPVVPNSDGTPVRSSTPTSSSSTTA